MSLIFSGHKHLPQAAGHAAFDVAQDMVGLLGCECTLLAHVHCWLMMEGGEVSLPIPSAIAFAISIPTVHLIFPIKSATLSSH